MRILKSVLIFSAAVTLLCLFTSAADGHAWALEILRGLTAGVWIALGLGALLALARWLGKQW